MRIKLSEKYKEQRDNICNKLITILNLDSNNTFLLCDLDNDLEKQKQIMDMKEDIQNVFACSTISAFKPNFECKRPYLNIVRSILRQQNYTFIDNDFTKKENNLSKKTIKYFVFINN